MTRLWFAWVSFFRVLLDGPFAASAFRLAYPPEGGTPLAKPLPEASGAAPAPSVPVVDPPRVATALSLLSLLQREGRLVDFLEQDVAAFSDADVGAAARVVHEGCRKALRSHAKIVPVRSEDEGSRVTLAKGFAPDEIKLTGKVEGDAPYIGVLRHKGWRATELTLPLAVKDHDERILAPAEVEL